MRSSGERMGLVEVLGTPPQASCMSGTLVAAVEPLSRSGQPLVRWS